MAPPFREAEFDIIYGEGISKEGDLVDLGVQHNLIEKSGAWYSYKGERIGQGRENAKQFLRENSDVFKKVDAELRKQLGLVRAEQPVVRLLRRLLLPGCGRNARAGISPALSPLVLSSNPACNQGLHSSRPME